MTKEKTKNSKYQTRGKKIGKKTRYQKKINSSDKKCIFGKVFANWCGACNALKPKWIKMVDSLNGVTRSEEELKEQLELDEPKKTLIINKDGMILEIMQIPDTDYESYKNERPELSELEASGYPTIFRKMNNSPIEYYNGQREPEAMIQWAMGSGDKSSRPDVIAGGDKSTNQIKKHNRTHKKSCGACKSNFSKSIAEFWGWK